MCSFLNREHLAEIVMCQKNTDLCDNLPSFTQNKHFPGLSCLLLQHIFWRFYQHMGVLAHSPSLVTTEREGCDVQNICSIGLFNS